MPLVLYMGLLRQVCFSALCATIAVCGSWFSSASARGPRHYPGLSTFRTFWAAHCIKRSLCCNQRSRAHPSGSTSAALGLAETCIPTSGRAKRSSLFRVEVAFLFPQAQQ